MLAVGSTGGYTNGYLFNGTHWVQLGTSFGILNPWVVSISSGVVAVSSFPTGFYRGNITVHEYNGSAWVQKGQSLYSIDSETTFGYGLSLSNNGNTVAVSAASQNIVRVYTFNGSVWVLQGSAISHPFDTNSGNTIDLSSDGNTIVIGSSGRVRTFRWMNPIWVQLGPPIDGLETLSGRSVAISADGNTIVSGTPTNFDSLNGNFRVYDYIGTTWVQRGPTVTVSGPATNNIGYGVDMSANGNTVATGGSTTRIYDTAWAQRGTSIGPLSYQSSLSPEGNRIAVGLGPAFIPGDIKVYCI
jgi:hypothetical protein